MNPLEGYLKFALIIYLGNKVQNLGELKAFSLTLPFSQSTAQVHRPSHCTCVGSLTFVCISFLFLSIVRLALPSSVSNRCRDSLSMFQIPVSANSSCESVCVCACVCTHTRSNTHRQRETASHFSSLNYDAKERTVH